MATNSNTNGGGGTPDREDPAALVAQASGNSLPDSVNFSRIGNYRQIYLRDQAERYINAADTDPTTRERSLDYNSFAGIQNHLSDRRDLNDLEKAFVWSDVADRKGTANNSTNRFENAEYSISLDGSKDEIWDRQAFDIRKWNTPNHSVASFMDGYHGFGSADGERGMAYDSREVANRRIEKHESFMGVNLNEGDTQASKRLVQSFRAYAAADWGNKFATFSNEWQTQMLETRGQDARNIDQRFKDFGGVAEHQWLRDQRSRESLNPTTTDFNALVASVNNPEQLDSALAKVAQSPLGQALQQQAERDADGVERQAANPTQPPPERTLAAEPEGRPRSM